VLALERSSRLPAGWFPRHLMQSLPSAKTRLTLAERYHAFCYSRARAELLDGFDVRFHWLSMSSGTRGRVTAKLRAALALLAEYAPHRLARLRRDVSRIWVAFTANLGEYHHRIGLCVLNPRPIADGEGLPPERIAALLVHEGTHARLFRRGLRHSDAASYARHERACVRAEVALLERLPRGAALLAGAWARLDETDEFWSAEARLERQLESLREQGLPRWLERFVRWRQRRRAEASPRAQSR
jgi:hypothetical protein